MIPLTVSKAELEMILDRLYDRFGVLGEAYNNPASDRRRKRRIRVERKALVPNSLFGYGPERTATFEESLLGSHFWGRISRF